MSHAIGHCWTKLKLPINLIATERVSNESEPIGLLFNHYYNLRQDLVKSASLEEDANALPKLRYTQSLAYALDSNNSIYTPENGVNAYLYFYQRKVKWLITVIEVKLARLLGAKFSQYQTSKINTALNEKHPNDKGSNYVFTQREINFYLGLLSLFLNDSKVYSFDEVVTWLAFAKKYKESRLISRDGEKDNLINFLRESNDQAWNDLSLLDSERVATIAEAFFYDISTKERATACCNKGCPDCIFQRINLLDDNQKSLLNAPTVFNDQTKILPYIKAVEELLPYLPPFAFQELQSVAIQNKMLLSILEENTTAQP